MNEREMFWCSVENLQHNVFLFSVMKHFCTVLNFIIFLFQSHTFWNEPQPNVNNKLEILWAKENRS